MDSMAYPPADSHSGQCLPETSSTKQDTVEGYEISAKNGDTSAVSRARV